MEIDGKLAWEEYNRCQFKLLARHLEWEDRSKKKKKLNRKVSESGKKYVSTNCGVPFPPLQIHFFS